MQDINLLIGGIKKISFGFDVKGENGARRCEQYANCNLVFL